MELLTAVAPWGINLGALVIAVLWLKFETHRLAKDSEKRDKEFEALREKVSSALSDIKSAATERTQIKVMQAERRGDLQRISDNVSVLGERIARLEARINGRG
jgi:hypothetical protein